MAALRAVAPLASPDAAHPDLRGQTLVRYLGPVAAAAFDDADVTEVYLNPRDGALRLDTRSRGRVITTERIPPHRVEMFLNAAAAGIGVTITRDQPRLEAELPMPPFRGSRLQGFVPPLVAAPSFTIRKPPTVVHTLDDYVRASIIAPWQRELLRAAVRRRWNTVIVGGTNSGKTTLANALLHEIATEHPGDRIVILEDTVELLCAADDQLALRTKPGVTLADLVRSTLRSHPDRIVVGEVRGAEALDLLDAWATGHPGGVATLHATSAEGALRRLDRLAQRANVPPQSELVAEAVDLVVLIQGGHRGRRVSELARVEGIGGDGHPLVHRITESDPCPTS